MPRRLVAVQGRGKGLTYLAVVFLLGFVLPLVCCLDRRDSRASPAPRSLPPMGKGRAADRLILETESRRASVAASLTLISRVASWAPLGSCGGPPSLK